MFSVWLKMPVPNGTKIRRFWDESERKGRFERDNRFSRHFASAKPSTAETIYYKN
jgi:hypothetical protein